MFTVLTKLRSRDEVWSHNGVLRSIVLALALSTAGMFCSSSVCAGSDGHDGQGVSGQREATNQANDCPTGGEASSPSGSGHQDSAGSDGGGDSKGLQRDNERGSGSDGRGGDSDLQRGAAGGGTASEDSSSDSDDGAGDGSKPAHGERVPRTHLMRTRGANAFACTTSCDVWQQALLKGQQNRSTSTQR